VSKAATDKMTADMAMELRPHAVTVVSLYPGLVRTEKVMEAAAWLVAANLAVEYGFTDIDGKTPRL
jgi:dehydrogenase/reductase SDR family member 1